MKKISLLMFITTACCFVALARQSPQPFTIKGKLGPEKEGKVFLQYQLGDQKIYDSAIIKKGVFLLNGRVNDIQRTWLTIRVTGSAGYAQDFFLEKGTVSVTAVDSLKKAFIQAGKTQGDYLALLEQEKPLRDKFNEVWKHWEENNKPLQNALKSQAETIMNEIWQVETAYILAHPDAYLSFDLIKTKSSVSNAYKYEALFDGLSARLQNSAAGMAFKKEVVLQKRFAIGNQSIDFTQNNTKGAPVTLASLKGKYVLLDFWASWCMPCRMDNPNLLKIYNKFRDSNFEILAVSLDNDRGRWIKAIKQDGLPWIQVSDLTGRKNPVAEAYGITGIPQNFLIDPDGKILARNLHDKDLEEALEKYLKQ